MQKHVCKSNFALSLLLLEQNIVLFFFVLVGAGTQQLASRRICQSCIYVGAHVPICFCATGHTLH